MSGQMKISQFISKYGVEYGLSYCTLYNMIKRGCLREGVHYRKSYRGMYEKFTVIPSGLINFLKNGKRD